MTKKTVFTVDNELFDQINCPVCEMLPDKDANCSWCGGAGRLEQVRLIVESDSIDPS